MSKSSAGTSEPTLKRREISLRRNAQWRRGLTQRGWVRSDGKAEASFGAEKAASRRSAPNGAGAAVLRPYSEEKEPGLNTRHYNGGDGDVESPLQESNLAGPSRLRVNWKPALQNKGTISRSLTTVRDDSLGHVLLSIQDVIRANLSHKPVRQRKKQFFRGAARPGLKPRVYRVRFSGHLCCRS